MDRELYNDIVRWVVRLNYPQSTSPLAARLPDVPVSTLGSISSQECMRRTKRSIYQHNRPEVIAEYHRRLISALEAGEPPGVLLRLSAQLEIAPALLAKFVLNAHLNATEPEYRQLADRAKRQRLNRLAAQPELGVSPPRVAHEVRLCVLRDSSYGPLAEAVKHTVGQEYELRLKKRLTSLNIPFLDEHDLRRRGFDKTPDFLLDVPIAVDGCVVNWVESKASFGDDETHEAYMRDQYEKYWSRFGPGMVIYWFGFILDLIPAASAKHVLLRERFPDREQLEFMEPLQSVLPVHVGSENDSDLGLQALPNGEEENSELDSTVTP